MKSESWKTSVLSFQGFRFISSSLVLLFFSLLIFSGCPSVREEAEEEKKVAGRWGMDVIKEVEKAQFVVVLGQSSHLDFTWVYTRDEYWDKFVKRIFDETVESVLSHPLNKSFFAEVYWVKRYYDELSAEKKEEFARLLREKLIEVVGGAWGTDDMLAVPREAIVRSYISGARWLSEMGVEVPHIAWIPDSFGFPAELPDLLYMLGFKAVAISRVNGFTHPSTYYVFGEIDLNRFREGSGGYKLFAKGVPVRWKGKWKDVILWFMPYLYGHGSKLFCVDDVPAPIYVRKEGGCLGEHADEEIFSQKLGKELKRMKKYVRGKFFFIPVGWDFERPFPEMGEFVSSWNSKVYPETGTYLLTGSFADFIELLTFFGEDKNMGEIQVELSPYWTGYFGSRIYLKRFIYEAVFTLLSLETLNTISWYFAGENKQSKIDGLWELVHFLSNHDSGAGTLYRVAEEKDIPPIMDEIKKKSSELLREIADELSAKLGISEDEVLIINPVGFRRWMGELEIPQAGYLRVRMTDKVWDSIPQEIKEVVKKENFVLIYDEGGKAGTQALFPFSVSVQPPDGEGESEKKYEVSFSLSIWVDEGGAWRTGNETGDCTFQELYEVGKDDKAGSEEGKQERISYTAYISDFRWRWRRGENDTSRTSKIIDITLDSIPEYRSALLKISFPENVSLAVEGFFGLKTYPRANFVYEPTFLPFQTFFVAYTESGRKFLFSVKGARGVAQEGNSLLLFVGRNAPFEKCDVLGPLPIDRWGDMGEDGPFRTTLLFTELYEDYEAQFISYSFQFPFIIIRGKGGAPQNIPDDFSLILQNPVLSLKVDERDKSFIATAFFPMRNINPGRNYSPVYPINPRTGEQIGISSYFKLFLSPPRFSFD